MSTVTSPPTEAPTPPVAERTIDDLPGPRGLPLLGNAHQLSQPRKLHRTMEAWARRYGRIYRFSIGLSQPAVVVTDAAEITRVLRERPERFRRTRRQAATFQELAPNVTGVFLAEGGDWHRQRRLVIAALHTNHLQRYFDVIHRTGLRLHRRLVAEVGEGATLDLSEILTAYTFDNTAALVFGQDLNTLEEGEGDLQRHISRITSAVLVRLFSPVPYWRWVKLPPDRAVERSVAIVDATLAGFVTEGRRRLAERPELREHPENLLDAMLGAQDAEGSFTDDEITSNINTLLSAGQDTTAHTLGWTLWLLSTRPDVQDRLAAEAGRVLGDEDFPADHAAVDRLEYADAVLRESIRLRPAAPVLPVETLEETVICGTTLPAGVEVLLMLREATRDGSDDADDFRPDRWLDDGPKPPKTLAFGSGPRFCPGRNLALVEVKSVIAMLTRSFEISLDWDGPGVEEDLRFAMAPSAYRVHLTPRRD